MPREVALLLLLVMAGVLPGRLRGFGVDDVAEVILILARFSAGVGWLGVVVSGWGVVEVGTDGDVSVPGDAAAGVLDLDGPPSFASRRCRICAIVS